MDRKASFTLWLTTIAAGSRLVQTAFAHPQVVWTSDNSSLLDGSRRGSTGLSGLEGWLSFVDILFIDERFRTLDAETLDVAIDALETLKGYGHKEGQHTRRRDDR